MSISSVGYGYPGMPPIKSIRKPEQLEQMGQGQKSEKPGGFQDTLKDAIKEMDRLEKVADNKIENFMLGKGGTTPHEAMIALEKADVAFQLMNNIRTRIIRAYEDVIRTQV